MRPTVCPLCSSQRIIMILRDEREILCFDCGSRWLERIMGETTILSVPESLPRLGAAAHEAIGTEVCRPETNSPNLTWRMSVLPSSERLAGRHQA